MTKIIITLCFFAGCAGLVYWQRDAIFNHHTDLSESEAFVLSQVRQGQTFGQPLIGGTFELNNQFGKKQTDKDFRGTWMLVYFGYTFCPDICPMALENMQAALKLLGPKAKNVKILFITIDPQRDTVSHLKKFLENYDSRVIGLTGTEEEIRAVKAAYRVHAVRVEDSDLKNYLIDHSSLIYVMSPQGQYVDSLNHETPPQILYEALNKLF